MKTLSIVCGVVAALAAGAVGVSCNRSPPPVAAVRTPRPAPEVPRAPIVQRAPKEHAASAARAVAACTQQRASVWRASGGCSGIGLIRYDGFEDEFSERRAGCAQGVAQGCASSPASRTPIKHAVLTQSSSSPLYFDVWDSGLMSACPGSNPPPPGATAHSDGGRPSRRSHRVNWRDNFSAQRRPLCADPSANA
jgi:hypothetical protein